ncbi:beta galactosidase jelly roll domain-containing protein [Pontibacter sp. G13]|uniref:beta galactosidase jelly roll domain-containing protein n=1 Tax=Pontibacter sp. G13 TaxID=3074898 RepID=UPI00288A1575|nr:beta galactosidase jelly roll domain-containing protein [Pontibacter sp. G13]WNJ20181.1 beta galactosidase jelly roll domain-containing protein [Pontibacter sp. G13]
MAKPLGDAPEGHIPKLPDQKLLDLSGYWRFSIGDRTEWALPEYDDRNWEQIRVPGYWEDAGFNGYDGYAWYRKQFNGKILPKGQDLFLALGMIDDADEVFVNGHLVGFSGGMPPHVQTAYNKFRLYRIPREFIRYDQVNTIAVRVYDFHLQGGIVKGPLGIYAHSPGKSLDMDLSGIWEFRLGDNLEWCEDNQGSWGWKSVMVPNYWAEIGLNDYDGFGWYRLAFELPEDMDAESYFLLMGKIDDYDQVYLNGSLIGSTGFHANGEPIAPSDWAYTQMRTYQVPAGLLRTNAPNVIHVRVYDFTIDGGIYEGPIGLIRSNQLSSFWRNYYR